MTAARTNPPPVTPDGRYVVVRGRLWRTSNPALSEAERQALVDLLMRVRRAVHDAKQVWDEPALEAAHAAVEKAKVALGGRGPVWWNDGSPDLNRHMAGTTCYAGWYASLGEGN